MTGEIRTAELALPWAAAMPDNDLHHFLNDLASAAMHRWQSDPDVPDRETLALVERACAQWRTPGEGFRSDAEDADTRLAAVWRVEECTDEYRENCPCMIVTGDGDRIQYAADAETPELAARIVADHNEVIALREQLEQADDEKTGLQLKLDRYVGKEPTLRDEMAYLHRCLNAVFNACRVAEKQATRWENPLPVPEWVSTVRSAAAGEHEDWPADNRRRIYLDGTGQAWIETTKGFVTQIEMPLWDGEPIANVREKTGEIHEIGRTW